MRPAPGYIKRERFGESRHYASKPLLAMAATRPNFGHSIDRRSIPKPAVDLVSKRQQLRAIIRHWVKEICLPSLCRAIAMANSPTLSLAKTNSIENNFS
jgi:hypothetical protein